LLVRRSLLKGPDHGALLLSSIGLRMTDRATRDVFKEINKRRTGKRHVHPHLLRHSVAVHLLRGGADVRHVQEFLGHASLGTTKIYLRLVPGRLKEDYEKSFPAIAVKA
jgi:site-specific recombinase XerD